MPEPVRQPRTEGTKMDNSKVDKLISKIVENICKDQGEGSASTLGDTALRPMVRGWLSTGSASLDNAVSGQGKGVPVGRLVEIFGPEASTKTTVSWCILASTQKKGGVAVLLEPESAAFDLQRARKIGLDPNTLVYSAPGTIEEVFSTMEGVIDTVLADDPDRMVTIVWDSVAATSTKRELEEDYGSSPMAEHARLISQGMRKIMSKVRENSLITLVFLNQEREKLGGYGGQSTFGGKAIKYYASVRIRLRPNGLIKGEADKVTGVNFEAEVVKNKVAPPFRKASYRILFDPEHGGAIDYVDSVLTVALEKGVVSQNGAWLAYGDKKFYRKDWLEILTKHPEIMEKI